MAAALAAGLVAAMLLDLIVFTVSTPAVGSLPQRLMQGAVLPVAVGVPLALAAAVYHGTQHRHVGVRAGAASATWVITLPIGFFIAVFIGCAAGHGCL
jgi:hypothetical protein